MHLFRCYADHILNWPPGIKMRPKIVSKVLVLLLNQNHVNEHTSNSCGRRNTFTLVGTRHVPLTDHSALMSSASSGFHIGDGSSSFLDDVKERPVPFCDAHQLGVRLNFDVNIKTLTSMAPMWKRLHLFNAVKDSEVSRQ